MLYQEEDTLNYRRQQREVLRGIVTEFCKVLKLYERLPNIYFRVQNSYNFLQKIRNLKWHESIQEIMKNP